MATYWENSCSFGLRCVSWYTCLIVSLVFSHLGFWSGNLFLIAPFPDLSLLVPVYVEERLYGPYSENKGADQISCAVTAQLICIFVFCKGENPGFLRRGLNIPAESPILKA